ncbi:MULTISPECIES: hypothetical protein [unclassified Rhizobium]|nr:MULTISPECIES: hypothetical protein [unclassified Rhizobium]
MGVIDVCDLETFDSELRGNLEAHGDVIHNYMRLALQAAGA